MLAIEMALLTGRYVATAYNRRTESEWPPHPARLFSALVAAHFTADAGFTPVLSAERAALEWLETQGAPSILASEAARREVVTVFVPVNDVALMDVDEEARLLDDARTALRQAEASDDRKAIRKAEASVRKADDALKKATARATEVPARPLDPRNGRRLLPDYRGRQPRTFPSVTPADHRVTYVWPDAAAPDELRASLDALLRRVARVGHSSSLVSLRLVESPGGPPTWRPTTEGEVTFRVVGPGQVAALERAFHRHREREPRVMPAVSQPYTRALLQTTERTRESIFSDDWLVLRRVEGVGLPMTAAAGIARVVRKALMSYADEPIPELLSGHASSGQPSERPHLAIVPLPFVGHERASGVILGVALIVPRAASEDDRRAVYRAVARWEENFRQEDEDTPIVHLNLGAAGKMCLERIEWGSVQSSLKSRTWCGPACVWHSATPVALDRNPGDLRTRDPRKLSEATDAAVELICRGCERIGLPQPKHVEILPAPAWAGSAKARHYPPYPGDTGRTQRVLTHVRIEFDQRVSGPILLGAGRYVGLGLFRPGVS